MGHFYDLIPSDLRALPHEEAIERFASGAGVPGQAIAGLSPEQLNAHPIPDTWSIQQIVVHLMDTDLIACYRMKRIIAEDKPELDLYDEVAFSQRLHYDKLDAHRACEVFRLNRLNMADILRALPHEAFERHAIHKEVGLMPLGMLLRLYVKHLDHHMGFLTKKRAMVT